MRGRLLLPFVAELFRLDTAATAADPDGPGALTSGYDHDFREPVKLPATALEGPGRTHRVEQAALRLPCQVEVGSMEKRTTFFSGTSVDSRLICVFHFRDLERLGLVDPDTGRPRIEPETRLNAIYRTAGQLVQRIAPPLYATQVESAEYGLGRARNLLVVYFEERTTAVST